MRLLKGSWPTDTWFQRRRALRLKAAATDLEVCGPALSKAHEDLLIEMIDVWLPIAYESPRTPELESAIELARSWYYKLTGAQWAD